MTIGARSQQVLTLGVLFTVTACGADGGTQNQASGGSTVSGGDTAVIDQWQAAAEQVLASSVSLRVRYNKRFQSPRSSGFVLSDASGPVMATEAGRWVKTLAPTDLASLEATR